MFVVCGVRYARKSSGLNLRKGVPVIMCELLSFSVKTEKKNFGSLRWRRRDKAKSTMMNVSTAPLAESEDLDDLSLRSSISSVSIPDRNHNISPRKNKIPPAIVNNNNNILPQSQLTGPRKDDYPLAQDTTDHSGVWNPAFLLALANFGAAMFFLVGLNLKGLTLLKYPSVGNLLNLEHQATTFSDGVIILQCLWCVHFVRKCVQVLFVNRYDGKIFCVSFTCLLLYYCVFGFWVGCSLNIFMKYRIPNPEILAPGVAVFLLGELGNAYCHWLLRKTRILPSGLLVPASSGTREMLPDSLLFRCITYPQFFFEVLTWAGFYICSHTVASGSFLVCTTVLVTVLAVFGHFQGKTKIRNQNYCLVQRQPWQK